MRAKSINEIQSFERGKDPRRTMEIGTFADVKQRWNDLQLERGIGSLNLEKVLDDWSLTLHVNTFPGQFNLIDEAVKKHMDPYLLGRGFMKQNTAIFPLKKEHQRVFIDVYNDRFPDWPITESISFERGKDPIRSMGEGITKDAIKVTSFWKWGTKKGQIGEWIVLPKRAEEILTYPTRGRMNLKVQAEVYLDGKYVRIRLDQLLLKGKNLIYNGKIWIPNAWGTHLKSYPINESYNFERGKDPKESMGIGRGVFQRIMDETGWEPAELRLTRDRINSFNNDNKDWFIHDLQLAYEKPENYNIDRWSGYYDDIKWAINNIDDAWELITLPNEELYPDEIDESINFQRGSDPKSQMGIGVKDKINLDLLRIIEKVPALGSISYMETSWPRYTRNYREGVLPQLKFEGDSYSNSFNSNFKSDLNRQLKAFGFDNYLLFPGRDVGKRSKEHYIYYLIKPGSENLFNDIQWISRFDARKARKGGLLESTNFERGKDPRRVMGIGAGWENLRGGTIIQLQRDLPRLGKYKGDLYKIKRVSNLGTPYDKRISYIPVDKNFNELRKWTASWELSKDFFEDSFVIRGISESISFGRGNDPMRSMGLGRREEIAKKYDKIADEVQYGDLQNVFGNEALEFIRGYNMGRVCGWINFHKEFDKLTPEQFAPVANFVEKWWKKIFPGRKLEESVNFERGKEPKESIGIGNKLARVAKDLDMSYEDAEKIVKVLSNFLSWDMSQEEFDMNIFHITNELDTEELREYGLHLEDQNFYTLKWADNNIQKAWEIFQAAKSWRKRNHRRIKRSDLDESVNFERGQDPKTTMGLGAKDIIKKGLVDLRLEKGVDGIDYYDEKSYIEDYLRNHLKVSFSRTYGQIKDHIVDPVKNNLGDFVQTPYDYMYFGDPHEKIYYFPVKEQFLDIFRRAFIETEKEFVIRK